MERLQLFQEMFRSLEADDELDVGNESERGMKDNSSVFGLSNLKEEWDWVGKEKMEFCFGHVKFEITI